MRMMQSEIPAGGRTEYGELAYPRCKLGAGMAPGLAHEKNVFGRFIKEDDNSRNMMRLPASCRVAQGVGHEGRRFASLQAWMEVLPCDVIAFAGCRLPAKARTTLIGIVP